MKLLKCAYCGTEFKPQNPTRRFCNRQCAGKAKRTTLEQRFWSHVEKTDTCWNWTGTIEAYGYGIFYLTNSCGKYRKPDGKFVKLAKAHRISWELHNTPLQSGECALHKCDNRRCVNPEHLFKGTTQDNTADMVKKGRNAIGTKQPQAKLTDSAVKVIKARLAAGETCTPIARSYGVTKAAIYFIKIGRHWKHVL